MRIVYFPFINFYGIILCEKEYNRNEESYILLMLLSLCGCAKEPTPPMLGSDGREIPMVFQNFPDIPFPDEAFLVLEDSKTMGSGENWIGSISFTVNFNAGRVFDYYVAEMPKKGWVEIAVVRAGISQMTYVKNGVPFRFSFKWRATTPLSLR